MSASRAAAAGALGGAVLALYDVAPSVMWLPDWSDRARFAGRMFLLLPALGALGAALLYLADSLAQREITRPAFAPLPAVVLAAPLVVPLVVATFSGRRASGLPFVSLIIIVLITLLLAGVYTVVRAAPAFALLSAGWSRRRTAGFVMASLVLALGLTTADRLLYPRHYEALHAALSAGAWLALATALWVPLAGRTISKARLRWVLLASLVFVATPLLSIADDHDGRAAMLSPRAANVRSVMLVLSPMVFAFERHEASSRALAQARRARERRRAAQESAEPNALSWEGAHLVLITIDALRADHLGAYGYERAISPTFDALAETGVLFERAWTPTPRSSYAICSLMTGRALQPRMGVRAETLAERLDVAGLHTAAFYPDGIFFHEGERLAAYRSAELGFSRRDAEFQDAESLTDGALRELDDLRQRGEPQSFLWFHYFDVHEPYRDRSLGDSSLDRYDGEIRHVDRELARLLDALSELTRDVVIVVTADHGEEHGEHGGVFHGGSLYEEQLRVPLLIVAPGLESRRVSAPVSLLDVVPTALAMLGLEPLSAPDGVDLRPALSGQPFDRAPVLATESGMRAVLRWPFKLVVEPSLIELYNLAEDPQERSNLASEDDGTVDELMAELALGFAAP